MARVNFDFSGDRILVTGAARGIGKAVATAFARAGGAVILLDKDTEVETVAGDIARQTGSETSAIICDITQLDTVQKKLEDLPALDVLVNNAGSERPSPIVNTDAQADDDFHQIIDINITGTYHVTSRATAKIKPGGSMIMTASIWGRTAVAEFSAYCASKHAVIGFMRSLAHELGPRGIRVNAVCPGWVRTGPAMNTLAWMVKHSQRCEDELLEEISAAQILPGLLEPDDVTDAYLFLASPAAANMTGQAINVDRGEVMS